MQLIVFTTSLAILASALASDVRSASLDKESTFITLGTMGGPIPGKARSQPANVLTVGEHAYLIDVGDGAVEQLAKAGVPLGAIESVFISHLHFDHTAGLAALIGLRYQSATPGVLTIYGPPGVHMLVDGILASMRPAAEAGFGIPGATSIAPETTVNVVEMRGGARITLAAFTLTAAKNTHYSFPEGSDLDQRFQSLSLRFDLADRSIVYTGDTGPSGNVEALAQGADLLISEMIDLDQAVARLRRARPDTPEVVFAGVIAHLRAHHLTAEQVGRLAANADVGAIVLTHLGVDAMTAAEIERYRSEIAASYSGPVTFSNDLERF